MAKIAHKPTLTGCYSIEFCWIVVMFVYALLPTLIHRKQNSVSCFFHTPLLSLSLSSGLSAIYFSFHNNNYVAPSISWDAHTQLVLLLIKYKKKPWVRKGRQLEQITGHAWIPHLCKQHAMWDDVLTVVNIKITVFWHVTPCSLVNSATSKKTVILNVQWDPIPMRYGNMP